jgi:5-(carboxyamino)imidazole ribonucleotide mutase
MSDGKAVVGIVLGSASDMAQVEPCVEVLRELDIAYELTVASAHRTPEEATAFARTARERGLKVIIAAAGWAAHLPGVLAAHTTLPIIGLPIGSSPLGGKDALYAMVQMPPGVPVATVGIDTGRNAGILAAQILGTTDDAVAQRLASLKEDMAEKVRQAARKLAGGH